MLSRWCVQELNFLEAAVKAPKRPFCAIVGGSKVSSKIDVLRALVNSCDTLIIGCAPCMLLPSSGVSVVCTPQELQYTC